MSGMKVVYYKQVSCMSNVMKRSVTKGHLLQCFSRQLTALLLCLLLGLDVVWVIFQVIDL